MDYQFCKDCSLSFKNVDKLLHHMESKHKSDLLMGFKCDVCNEIFKLKIALNKHKQKLHNAKWKCPKCSEIFDAEELNNFKQCQICKVSLVGLKYSIIEGTNKESRVLNQEQNKKIYAEQAFESPNTLLNRSDSVPQSNKLNVTVNVNQNEKDPTNNTQTAQLRKDIQLFFKQLCSANSEFVTSTPIKINKTLNFENSFVSTSNNEIIAIDDENDVKAEDETSTFNISGSINSNLTTIHDKPDKRKSVLSTYKCAKCSSLFWLYSSLQNHIQDVHKVDVEKNKNEKKLVLENSRDKEECKPSTINKKIKGAEIVFEKPINSKSNNKSKLALNANQLALNKNCDMKHAKSKKLSKNVYITENNLIQIDNSVQLPVEQKTAAHHKKNKKITGQKNNINTNGLFKIEDNFNSNCALNTQNNLDKNFLLNYKESNGQRISKKSKTIGTKMVTLIPAAANTKVLNFERDNLKSENSAKKRRKLFNLTTSIDLGIASDTADSTYEEIEGCSLEKVNILNPYTINKQLRSSRKKIVKSKSFDDAQSRVKNFIIDENINQDFVKIDEMMHKPSSGIKKGDYSIKLPNEKEKSKQTENLETIQAKSYVRCKSMIEICLSNTEKNEEKVIEKSNDVESISSKNRNIISSRSRSGHKTSVCDLDTINLGKTYHRTNV